MMTKCLILLGIAVLVCVPAAATGQSTAPSDTSTPPSYVYVAPNVLQFDAERVFTSFTLTNTTAFWFNPQVYLIDLDGVIVRRFSPLLKAFGSWQKPSTDLLDEDFQGSIWIVSSEPIAASVFMYQYSPKDGALTSLGSGKLEQVSAEVAAGVLKRVAAGD